MRELLGQFDLVDIWRILNPEKRRYTFRQKTPLILSRLDYYMVSNSLQDNIVKTDIIPSIWSDHSAITLFVKHLPPTKKGNGYWKFNSSLVSDNKYVTDLCTEIEKWQQKYETMQDDRIIWELFKYEIRKFTMSYCSQKKLDKNLHESLKLKELEELEENLSLNPSDESILKIEQVRKEIRDIEEEKIKGSIIRSKIRWIEEGEKSSKFFFNLEKQNYIKKQVRKLTLNNGITVTDQQTIGKEMESFYSKLYKSELNYNKLDNTFFTSEKIPTISNIERDIIDAPITIEECKITLNTFKKNKSPGNDGLTYEFYDKFWNIISNILIKSYHAAFEKGELTVSQRQAIITLLEKPGKDRQLLKNWRPISLLNLDYKILSKTLSLRIQKYLPNLIHENQSGFVEGRYIGDSVRAVQDMMAFTELNKKDGILLFIDFEKAFDTIEWTFLWRTLEAFKFGNVIIKWIRILYTQISSCIINNGTTSRYFALEKGVRQGDPLSPYLFILVIELLAIRLREDPEVVGLKIDGSMQKLSVYADDMTVAVTDIESAKRAFQVFKIFAQNSGLKMNMEKTEGMWLGRQKNNLEEPLGILWPKEPIKALGIFHSYDQRACAKANFEDKIAKLIKQLHWWKARNLSLIGKIMIVKSLGISKFALVASLLHIPEDIIKRINTIIFSFIWNGKTDKVKRKILIQKYDLGGLKMIDFRNYVNAAKCVWIKKYLSSINTSWKRTFECFSKKENLALFLRSNFDINEVTKSLPDYYKDSILTWHLLKSKGGREFIWYNKDIKINKKTIYNHRLFQAGLWTLEDLYVDKIVIQFHVWLKRGAMPNDFLLWRGLVQKATKENLNSEIKFINRGYIQINNQSKEIEGISQSDLNECFNRKDLQTLKKSDFKAKVKHENIHGAISDNEWRCIFNLLRSVKSRNYVKDIQYKIIYRFLATNKLLYKMKKVVSQNCSFCHIAPESLEHLLYNCNMVMNFWLQVFGKWNEHLNTEHIDCNLKIVIFGLLDRVNLSEKEAISLNLIILCAKSYIWTCKQNKNNLNVNSFMTKLEEELTIVQQTGPIHECIMQYIREE